MKIQDIENLNLDELSIKEIARIRDDLRDSFVFAKLSNKLSDGRSQKIVIGEQESRLSKYLWTTDRIPN